MTRLGSRQRVECRRESVIIEVHLGSIREARGGEPGVVVQHALGGRLVPEEVPVRLQCDRTRQREREQQQRGDEQAARTG